MKVLFALVVLYASIIAPTGATAAPGTPGTPQPPTLVLGEDFQNVPGPIPIVNLANYTGTMGQTYTAAPEWLSLCNGWISSAGQPPNAPEPIADCQQQTFWNESQQMSQALGIALGQSAEDAQANYALSAFTTSSPGVGKIEFATATNIESTTPNPFITFSVDVAAVNCNQTHPLLQFSLLNKIDEATPAGTQIDPCASPTTVNVPAIGVSGPKAVLVGKYTANVLMSGSVVGVRMVNGEGSGAGNDHAIDNLEVFDVSPQLDGSFSPALVGVGQTSTLTLTVTNTDELAAKNGWSFDGNLPAGLTVADAATTTCPAGIVTAPIGGSAISVAGNLDAGTLSCTVTVQVTSSTSGPFVNDASRFVSVVGLRLPGPAAVTFAEAPALTIVASSTTTSVNAVGQVIPYMFEVTNGGDVEMTGIAVTDLNTTVVSCPEATLALNGSMTCTGTHTVVQADLDAGSIVNTASVVGTSPAGTPIQASSNQVTVVAVQTPALTIAKSSTTTSVTAVGQVIPYAFVVTNTGNVTMTSVAVNDPKVGTVTCPQTTVAAGASMTCTASYTVTQADVTAGMVLNTASVVGTPPSGTPITAVVSNEVLIAVSVTTTTTPPTTTTTPPATTTTTPTAVLPVTGTSNGSTLTLALALTAVGLVLAALARRRLAR